MATKRSANEVFQDYYRAMMFSLPMTNPKFLNDLYKHILIPEEFKSNLESLTVRKERTSYFLDHIIKPQISVGDNTSFVKLLIVMKKCNEDNVKDLAEEIEAQCALDVKSMKSTPSLQDLTKLVTPEYAAKWKDIGSLLGLKNSELEIIEHYHGHNAINCCNRMWENWLDRDTSATWNDVLNVLEHTTVKQKKMIIPADNDTTKAKEQPAYSVEDLEKKSRKANAQNMVVNYVELNAQQKEVLDETQAMIIVVNQNEFMATMCYLEPPNEHFQSILEVHGSTEVAHTKEPFIFYIGMFGKCPVAVTRVDQGRGRDAIDHIKHFPNILLIAAVGVAAGFPENKVHYGDVVISTIIKDCSIYREEDRACTPRGYETPGCKHMIGRLKNNIDWEFVRSKQGTKSSVILGMFLSKPVLLDSEGGRAAILRDFGKDAKGFEMEGFGITRFGIECIIIKGVCDYASGKTKEWQPTAALAANDYLHHHLNQLDLSSMKIVKDDLHKDKNKNLPKLDIHQLNNIVRYVQEKWQVIALNLGVPKNKLDSVSQEAEKEKIPFQSLNTFCCIKMLSYWFKNGDNVSANAIIEVIRAPHVGLKDKISSIQDALTSNNINSVKMSKKYATSPPGSHEISYVEMKTNVCNEFEKLQCSINSVLLYLQNCNIDPDILTNISNFPGLFKSFEAHNLLHAGDPAWLTAIAKHVKCTKALEVIEEYSALLIADKTMFSHDSCNKPINGFVAKLLDKNVENFTVKDCSDAKAAVSKVLDLKDTDGILDHAEIGSLTFYWRVKENITITIPKFTCASLIKKCKDTGITHIGTITDGNLQIVEIDEFKGNKIEKGIKYLEQQYEYIILGGNEHEEWPPDQPNVYTISILTYHKEKFVSNDTLQICKITKHNRNVYKENSTQNVLSYANDDYCKNISDIFVPIETEYSCKSPKTILIEGDPGIGKTMLANQVALQWRNINLLCDKMFLFLIYLRDPKVHEMRTMHDLLIYMFRDDMLEDYNICIQTYEAFIEETNGSCLAILFDGYDELSQEKRTNSFVSKIIHREILKECLLIITSRPFGSEDLHFYTCRRIKLLGFTEEDRVVHLKNSLKNPQKFKQLMQYLEDHPTINTLCYNSLNMTMFVYLFKQNNHLPTTQTELFDMFISQTVTHFLNKYGFFCTFNSLSQFKGKHDSILKELGKLSFHSLCKDKMVFSSDDLKIDCPKYFSFISENKCSYGLLKEKRRLCTAEKSCNFLHLTIQEYLAAWHLSNFTILNQRDLNYIFHTYFWEQRFFNVWVLYVGITKGKKLGFKHFLSGNTLLQTLLHRGAKRLSPETLHNKFKSMYLFQCFKESDDLDICTKLGLLLEDQVIDLRDHQMSPKDINTLCFVLTQAIQYALKELNLSNCGIGDTGCKWFCEDLIKAGSSKNLWIKTLNLSSNQLTTSSVDLLIELTCAIRIQNLMICDNQLLDKEVKLLCKNCKNLEFLCLENKNILRADQILISLFYDTNKPCISIAFKESICLQQTSLTLPPNVDPDLIRSLYVDGNLSSNLKWLTQVMQKLTLLKFHAIIKLSQSKEIVSLIMKMDTIKELYVNQLNDEAFDLIVKFLQQSNVAIYALTSLSKFKAENVHNAQIINSALKKCCTFQSVTNLILHNCRFCTEDLTATIASKTHWNTINLTACGIDVSKLSYLYEYFSYPEIAIDTFKLN